MADDHNDYNRQLIEEFRANDGKVSRMGRRTPPPAHHHGRQVGPRAHHARSRTRATVTASS